MRLRAAGRRVGNLLRGSPLHGAAHLGGKNLAGNLTTLHGQTRKIDLQGTCKVAFFAGAVEQKRTKIYRYFMSLRRKMENWKIHVAFCMNMQFAGFLNGPKSL
jgi:hypothetical protein